MDRIKKIDILTPLSITHSYWGEEMEHIFLIDFKNKRLFLNNEIQPKEMAFEVIEFLLSKNALSPKIPSDLQSKINNSKETINARIH